MAAAQKIKLGFIILFIIIIVSPAIQMAGRFVPEKPLLEYRELAEFPKEIKWDMEGFKETRSKFEKWFNDHIGFRGTLIRVLNEVLYRLFRKAQWVYVGKDGWLFQKVFYDGTWIAAQPSMDDHYKKVFERWIKLRDLLKNRGITLVVCCIPLKHDVYPELMPFHIKKMPPLSRFDKFRQFLDDNGIDRVEIKKALIDSKKSIRIFRKQDLHWTIQGGFVGAKALLDKIATLELGHTIPWRFSFHFTQGKLVNIGSESRALPLLWDMKEYWGETDPDGRTGVPPLELNDNNPWDRIYRMEGINLLPPIVVLNDSFFENMERCGFQYHFKSLHTGRPLTHDPVRTGFNAMLKVLPTDTKYFVMVFMENDIENELPEWSNLE